MSKLQDNPNFQIVVNVTDPDQSVDWRSAFMAAAKIVLHQGPKRRTYVLRDDGGNAFGSVSFRKFSDRMDRRFELT